MDSFGDRERSCIVVGFWRNHVDDRQFWDILGRACVPGATADDWFESLKQVLLSLPDDEIIAFRYQFDHFHGAAFKSDLWGAAYLINGGCSNDGFHSFRCWLVGSGEAVYKRAMENADALADILTGESPCEAE